MSATTKTAPELRAVLQQALETLDHDPVSLAEVAAWIPRKVVAIAAIRAALDAPAAASGAGAQLRRALEAIERELTNLQPHIPQACKKGHEPFIDAHVDVALQAARDALAAASGAGQQLSPDALEQAQRWRKLGTQAMQMIGRNAEQFTKPHREQLHADFAALLEGPNLLAAAPAAAPDIGDELHGRIMNLPCRVPTHDGVPYTFDSAYKLGHRDARHAAAELVGEVQAAAPVAPAAAQAQPEFEPGALGNCSTCHYGQIVEPPAFCASCDRTQPRYSNYEPARFDAAPATAGGAAGATGGAQPSQQPADEGEWWEQSSPTPQPAHQPLTDEQLWTIREDVALNQVLRMDDGKTICIKHGRAVERACAEAWGVTLLAAPAAGATGEQP